MASVVFSAKRKSIEIEFVFEDGQSVNLIYLAKTQKEVEDDIAFGTNSPSVQESIEYSKQSLKKRLVCDSEVKELMVQEIIATASIGEFEGICEGAIKAAKKQK